MIDLLLLRRTAEVKRLSDRIDGKRRALQTCAQQTRISLGHKLGSPIGLLLCFSAGFVSGTGKLNKLPLPSPLRIFPFFSFGLDKLLQFIRGR